MGFEICCLIYDERICRTVRLIEAVIGKMCHQVKYLIGQFRIETALSRPFQKVPFLRFQDSVFLFPHRTTQKVCLSKRKTAHRGSDLHDLLLIKDNAERIF